jgi:uncharacterized membrane protein YbhN (UPF0104 family)
VLGFLLYRAYGGLIQFIESGAQLQVEYLLVSLVFQILGVLAVSGIWSNILARMGVRLGYFFDFRVYCVSALARKLPGVLWYAVGRMVLYNWRKPRSARIVALALAIEVVSISLAGALIVIFNLAAGLYDFPIINITWLIILGIVVVLILVIVFGPRLIQWGAHKLYYRDIESDEAYELSITHIDALKWILGYIFVIAMGAAVIFFLIKAIDVNLDVPYTLLWSVWALTLVIAPIIMWIPSSYLLGDGLLYLALVPITGASTAALITLAWRLWAIILEVSFGVFSGLSLGKSELSRFAQEPPKSFEINNSDS